MSDGSARAAKASGLSYRARLVLGVCGLVVATGALVLWLAHRGSRAGTDALTESLLREVGGRAADHTRAYVARAEPVVESLVRLAASGLAVNDPDRLGPQLLAVLRANPGLTWVSYGNEAGQFTGAYRTGEGVRLNRSMIVDGRTRLVEHLVRPDDSLVPHRTDPDSGYDPRTRPFYVAAKGADRPVWLPPYAFYESGLPGVSCAGAVRDASGKLKGVVSVDFDLDALSGFVAGLKASEHSRAFLFTADGTLLAHPDGRAAARAGGLPTLADSGDPLVEAYRAAMGAGPLDSGESRRFAFRHAGADFVGTATAFPVGDGQVWVAGVAAPESDFAGDLWRTQALALIAAGAAVLGSVVLALALADGVSRPIRRLTAFMGRVGGGDLEARADLGGGREFREVSAGLNRMLDDLRDRLRLRHSLGVAMEVQQRLLPAGPPKVEGLDVAGHSTYCDETGGDYYDFLLLDKAAPGTVLVALGDVMGHGVAAALVMAGIRAVLRDRAAEAGSLAEIMGRLNRTLSADLGGDRFMTLYLAVIDARAGVMRWASAGHDPAFVYDPATDRFDETESASFALGVIDEADYEEATLGPLRPGQVVVVGTDGVWDMPGPGNTTFGKDRLREAIRESAARPAAEIARTIRERLTEFQGDEVSTDDVTFVVVKIDTIPTT